MADEKFSISSNSPSSGAAYQVVARRYRPQGFDSLVGQGNIAQALSNAISTHRIGHAYLFTGARGVGKTSTARIFAKSLNCEKGPTPSPCNECDSCVGISTGEDVDVLEIDGASNRGIDEIRQLRQNASIRPSRSKYKIYIIDEVHMLTREAFNALLKTLEEPPNHVKFIFCTTEATKIPITILSRCQRFDFAGIEPGAIAKRLEQIALNEGVTADPHVFETLARRAAGSMRDGQSLLEQLLSFAPQHIKIDDVNSMLGSLDDQRLFRLIEAMTQAELSSIFRELDDATNKGVDVGVLVEQLIGIFRDLMVAASGGGSQLMLYTDPNQFDKICGIAQSLGLQRILASLQILDHSHNRMRFSTQSRTLLEMALIRIASLDQLQQIASLIEQMRGGEITVKGAVPIKPVHRSVPQVEIVSPVPPDNNGVAREALTVETDSRPLMLAPEEAMRAWKKTASQLPLITGSCVEQAISVTFKEPNIFIVLMPSPSAKQFCEKESARIQAVLSSVIGRQIAVSFELEQTSATSPPSPAAKSAPRQSVANKGKMMAEIADLSIIKKAESLFRASLTDVKEG